MNNNQIFKGKINWVHYLRMNKKLKMISIKINNYLLIRVTPIDNLV